MKGISPPSQVPAGVMFIWPTDTAPIGWLLCYGQQISRSDYARLFALIGTTFGIGDGSTTFNLPDLRGRLPLGKDDMGGVSANRVTNAQADTIGGSEGDENHTLTTAQMPIHAHPHIHAVTTIVGTGATRDGLWEVQDEGTSFSSVDTDSGSANAGSGGAHNNVQPYLTTNYIIKC